jgi:hypothetical protein
MFNPPPAKKVSRHEALLAAEVLGLFEDPDRPGFSEMTEEMVRSAFRRRVIAVHPDSIDEALGGRGAPAEVIAEAKQAKESLLAWLHQTTPDPHCPRCKGKGTVPTGSAFQAAKPCPLCQR